MGRNHYHYLYDSGASSDGNFDSGQLSLDFSTSNFARFIQCCLLCYMLNRLELQLILYWRKLELDQNLETDRDKNCLLFFTPCSGDCWKHLPDEAELVSFISFSFWQIKLGNKDIASYAEMSFSNIIQNDYFLFIVLYTWTVHDAFLFNCRNLTLHMVRLGTAL